MTKKTANTHSPVFVKKAAPARRPVAATLLASVLMMGVAGGGAGAFAQTAEPTDSAPSSDSMEVDTTTSAATDTDAPAADLQPEERTEDTAQDASAAFEETPLEAGTAEADPAPKDQAGEQPATHMPVAPILPDGAPTEAPDAQDMDAQDTDAQDMGAQDPDSATTAPLPETALDESSHPYFGVTTVDVNLRESDDNGAEILMVLPQGTEVRFSECGQWWCSVTHEGLTGYVGQRFIARD